MTLPTPLVDIGLNLAHDSFDHDRDHVVATAVAAGVAAHGDHRQHAREHPRRDRAGPRGAGDASAARPGSTRTTPASCTTTTCPRLRELLAAPEVGAAGECGLDYFRNFSPHDDQERAFRWQLELAAEAGKPVFLHQRDAHDAFVAILREYLPRLPAAWRIASPATSANCATTSTSACSIGITGWICDERRGQHLRDLVRLIPLDRLMVETDAPYLMPRDLQPKPSHRRNEPKYLPHIVKVDRRLPRRVVRSGGGRHDAQCARVLRLPDRRTEPSDS